MTDTPLPRTDEHQIDDRDLFEPSPSAGYRAVYAVLGVDPTDADHCREVAE